MIIIFVIAIISSLTFLLTSTAYDVEIYQKYVQDYKNKEQLYLISDTAIKAVEQFLKKDDSSYDSLNDFWAKEIPIITQDAQITLTVIDQERYLNPNILIKNDRKTINEKVFPIFERIFDNLGYDTSILYNIIDWIDKDDISQGGKENYTDYKAKNDYIESLNELRLIDGVDDNIFNGKVNEIGEYVPGLKDIFSPYLNGKININTAPIYILQALDPAIDKQIALNIITYRKTKPFKKIDDLALVDGINSDIIYRLKKLNILDIKSENFLVDIKIEFRDNTYHIIALINRKEKNTKLIWRKIY
ncbi:type II secretion system minor pseudopilin [Hydrogenothermus marinus]|uniref:General secretion pathway protein K n=1 Tax=Hydrogenothermus marinus TaxID=133270 RepID=A0A3M0B9A9_9AQUI|nr:helix-hairpin-helix domain-containing protein [Hydrogenothermus marinus]RMA93166.1 general secretion pathway protein K [Hydrogenothermus marinus]